MIQAGVLLAARLGWHRAEIGRIIIKQWEMLPPMLQLV
jgi:hypothetical protein